MDLLGSKVKSLFLSSMPKGLSVVLCIGGTTSIGYSVGMEKVCVLSLLEGMIVMLGVKCILVLGKVGVLSLPFLSSLVLDVIGVVGV